MSLQVWGRQAPGLEANVHARPAKVLEEMEERLDALPSLALGGFGCVGVPRLPPAS
jgi:hypothetical protein